MLVNFYSFLILPTCFIPIFIGGQFAEDGSFIGQYVPGKLNPPVSPQPIHHTAGSSGAATYV